MRSHSIRNQKFPGCFIDLWKGKEGNDTERIRIDLRPERDDNLDVDKK